MIKGLLVVCLEDVRVLDATDDDGGARCTSALECCRGCTKASISKLYTWKISRNYTVGFLADYEEEKLLFCWEDVNENSVNNGCDSL